VGTLDPTLNPRPPTLGIPHSAFRVAGYDPAQPEARPDVQRPCRPRRAAPVRARPQPVQQRPPATAGRPQRQDAPPRADLARDQEQKKFSEAFTITAKTLAKFGEAAHEHVQFLNRKAGLIEDYLKQR
jgi:hypothetical protein